MSRSGRESFVAVMEPADLWESDDPARALRLHAAGFGAVLRERQVRATPMVVVAIRPENLPQVSFGQDNYVVQALSADRSDDAFRVGVLPG